MSTLLDEVGIGAERRLQLRKFSKGMLQRVGIAQALVNDPEVVFFDEPMSGLDPLGRREIRELILRLRDRGCTVFFSSHVLSDAETLCSKVAIVAGGRLAAAGDLSELLAFQVRAWELVVAGVNETHLERARAAGDVTRVTALGAQRFALEVPLSADPARVVAGFTAHGAARGNRLRGELHRHCRRVWRRAERAARGEAPARTAARDYRGRHQAGRRLPAQTPEGYTRENLTAWVERSLQNLEMDAIDLLQLHCPPPALLRQPDVFGLLDDLVRAGKLRDDGVSVETVEEALASMRHPEVQSLQIIFNMFRLKPAEQVLPEARARRVGVLARVPLASGLLTGTLRADTVFPADDHRTFNRDGQSFSKGETLSGVPDEAGLAAVERLRPLVPPGATLAQLALKWILMFDDVTCAIPGAKTEAQARENAAAGSLPPLSPNVMIAVEQLYDERIRPLVHGSW